MDMEPNTDSQMEGNYNSQQMGSQQGYEENASEFNESVDRK